MKSRYLSTHLLDTISITRIRSFLIYCLFFSVVIQTGKHFWPDFAFVSGIRVDYLAPTLYFSDIVIFFLFFIELYLFQNIRGLLWIFSIFLFLSLYTFFVAVPGAHLYGTFLVLKFSFVVHVVAKYFSSLHIPTFLSTLSFAVLISALLGMGQFFLQSSFQGPFYYIGERFIDVHSVNSATFYAQGREMLRPYSSFSHPNVFAFFLLFSCSILIWSSSYFRDWIYRVSVLLGVLAITLTFSRLIIILFTFQVLYFFYKKNQLFYGIVIFVAGIFLLILFSRLHYESLFRDFAYRWELANIAFLSGSLTPLFGEGLLQYFSSQIEYFRAISPLLLQPVHNIYLLAWIQLGLFGVGGLTLLIGASFRAIFLRVKKSASYLDTSLFFLLTSVVILGLFDHYFLTVQQGQLLFSLIIGLCLRRSYGCSSGDGSGRGHVVQ